MKKGEKLMRVCDGPSGLSWLSNRGQIRPNPASLPRWRESPAYTDGDCPCSTCRDTALAWGQSFDPRSPQRHITPRRTESRTLYFAAPFFAERTTMLGFLARYFLWMKNRSLARLPLSPLGRCRPTSFPSGLSPSRSSKFQ